MFSPASCAIKRPAMGNMNPDGHLAYFCWRRDGAPSPRVFVESARA